MNYTVLSNEGPYDRDSIQLCIKEILLALSRCLFIKKSVHLDFCEVGRVIVKDSKIHMKFFRNFIKQLDIDGELENVFRPQTAQSDLSIMTTPSLSRSCSSSDHILPRLIFFFSSMLIGLLFYQVAHQGIIQHPLVLWV